MAGKHYEEICKMKRPMQNKFRMVRTEKRGSVNCFASVCNTKDIPWVPHPAHFLSADKSEELDQFK